MTETEEQILILLREIKELLSPKGCEHNFVQKTNCTADYKICSKCRATQRQWKD